MSEDEPRLPRVAAAAAGARLDAWLAGELGLSRSAAAALAEKGAVVVDGVTRGKGHRLAGGEQVGVAALPDPAPAPAPVAEVVFYNDDLWIVDKPAGLVVHPAPGHRGRTLVEQLGADGDTALAVHRLDRDTSGLMIVARDAEVRDELQAHIRDRLVEREYLALASGRLRARTGTIDAPLGRDAQERRRMSVREGGREARTHFEVVELLPGHSYVRARLETGRTHQIRVHFAAIGHPLAGDQAYGGRGDLGLRRQFLHSARLRFAYSGSPDPIEVTSDLPEDLGAALGRARA